MKYLSGYTLLSIFSSRTLTWAFALGFFLTNFVQGAFLTRTWNGSNANWALNGQWTPIGFPNNDATNTFHAIINSGRPVLNVDITLDQITFNGGIIAGTKNLTILNSTTWSGGEFTGTGTWTLSGTVTLDVSDKNLTGNRQVVSGGTTTLSAGNLHLYAPGNASLAPTWTNNGTFNATDEADIVLQDFGGSRPRVINSATGTFNKSGAATETIISTEFDNAGSVNVNSGSLGLYGGTDTGSYTLASGTELNFYGGVRTLSVSASIIGTGNVSVYGGNVTVDGTLNLSGSGQLVVQGGSIDINGVFAAPNSITVSGGAANFNTTPITMSGPVSLSAGSLGGSANLTVNNTFEWTGGEQKGTGTTTLSGAVTLDGGDKHLTGNRQVVSGGTTTLSAANFHIYAPGDESTAPTWTNNGTFNAIDEADIVLQDFGGSRPRVINSATGTFNKSGAATETIISTEFDNAGSVNVNSGSLGLYGGTDTGSYTLASGTELNFYGGVRTINSGASFSGAGTVGIQNSSEVQVESSTTFTAPLLLNGGVLSGSASVAINGGFHWMGGTQTGTGTTTLSGAVTLDGGDKHLTGNRQVVSGGTTTLSAANFHIYAPGDESTAPTWTNNGTFNAIDEADIVLQDFGGSRPRVINSATGTFNKSGAATETIISTEFDNAGSVNINSGRLNFAGQYKQTAGNLKLNGGALTTAMALDIQGGRLTGTGTITGDVANNGTIAPGLSAGSLTIAGDLTLGTSSKFEFEIGGPTQGTQYDFVTEAGVAPLNLKGLLSLNLINGFVPTTSQTFAVLRSNAALTGAFSNVASGSRLFTTDGIGSFLVRYGVGAPNSSRVTLSNFLFAGDFDLDGDVDGRDFLVWQRGGSPNGINSGDLAKWQAQYGSSVPLAAAATAVPEPSAMLLGFVGLWLRFGCRFRSRR